jgi:hypothetical protein
VHEQFRQDCYTVRQSINKDRKKDTREEKERMGTNKKIKKEKEGERN